MYPQVNMDYGAFEEPMQPVNSYQLAGLADFDFDAVTQTGKHFVCVVLTQVKLKQGLKTAMSISSEGNAYLQVSMLHALLFYGVYIDIYIAELNCILMLYRTVNSGGFTRKIQHPVLS